MSGCPTPAMMTPSGSTSPNTVRVAKRNDSTMSSTVSTTVPSRSKTTGSKPEEEASDTMTLQVELPRSKLGEQLRIQQVIAQRCDRDAAPGDDVEVGVGPLAGAGVVAGDEVRDGSARRLRAGGRSRPGVLAAEEHAVVTAGATQTGGPDAVKLGQRPVGEVDVEDAVTRQAAGDDVLDHGAQDRL